VLFYHLRRFRGGDAGRSFSEARRAGCRGGCHLCPARVRCLLPGEPHGRPRCYVDLQPADRGLPGGRLRCLSQGRVAGRHRTQHRRGKLLLVADSNSCSVLYLFLSCGISHFAHFGGDLTWACECGRTRDSAFSWNGFALHPPLRNQRMSITMQIQRKRSAHHGRLL
jgi:hypothetical protein